MKAVVLTGHRDLDRLQYMDYLVPEVADDEVLMEVMPSIAPSRRLAHTTSTVV